MKQVDVSLHVHREITYCRTVTICLYFRDGEDTIILTFSLPYMTEISVVIRQ